MPFEGQTDVQPLPVELLANVFSFFPMRDLLLGPAVVCHSWRKAALGSAVWMYRSYSHKDELKKKRPFLKAVLSVAPCLRYLEVDFCCLDAEALELLCNTSCAVKHFKFWSIGDKGSPPDQDIDSLNRILLNQVKLGLLDALSLRLKGVCGLMLIHAIGDALITQLDLKLHDVDAELFTCLSIPMTRPASLKRLLFWTNNYDFLAPMLEHFLEPHAATLEVVEIRSFCSRQALRLLGKCTRLHKLVLWVDQDVSDILKSCAHLRSLAIKVWSDAPLLRPYFMEATELVQLRIQCIRCDEGLVKALSSSGHSALEELWLGGIVDDELLNAIPAALPGLPKLRRLRLVGGTSPSREFLDAINPTSAPSLRLFEFDYSYSINIPALYSLVQRNPLLHVLAVALRGPCAPNDDCAYCLEYVPTESRGKVEGEKQVSRNLFSHSPLVACDLEQHKNNSHVNWVWVGAASAELIVEN